MQPKVIEIKKDYSGKRVILNIGSKKIFEEKVDKEEQPTIIYHIGSQTVEVVNVNCFENKFYIHVKEDGDINGITGDITNWKIYDYIYKTYDNN